MTVASASPARSSELRFGNDWTDEGFDGHAAWAGMRSAFDAAAAAEPAAVCEASFSFAGRAVRLTVVGRELFDHFVKPFAHLRCDDARDPELFVDVWDDRLIGWLPPPERAEGRTLWREATLRSGDDRFIAQRLPHTMSCLDRERRHVVAGIAWHDAIFIYERSKPLARLLLRWYNDRQVQIVHTGLVARNGNGVLIAGKSGTGKSTSALASVIAGLDYLSEDYVGLESAADGSFVGHSVYSSVFLKSDHLARFAALAPHAIHGRPPEEEKSVVILSQVFPERLAASARVKAIVFPTLADGRTADLAPMSKGAALLSLAPSSLLQIPNRELGATGLHRLGELVQRVPCFRMTVGGDFASIPCCLDALLADVESADRRRPGPTVPTCAH
jgi:hypothetical protein